jgi:putative aminopeptidase FrvX
VYPFYSSDGSAAWRAGADLRVALVGPGVDASHSFERTHVRALSATFDLLAAYALSDAAVG